LSFYDDWNLGIFCTGTANSPSQRHYHWHNSLGLWSAGLFWGYQQQQLLPQAAGYADQFATYGQQQGYTQQGYSQQG
jgi:hypothetical protein